MASATATQDMVRPGEGMDLYYYDGETSKKQVFPTTQNTKFVQQFQNTNGGTSVFTIPPNQGIQDIVCEFKFTGTASTGLALPRGWGYALVKSVSFRYGGSSQYFLTGDQILQNALRRQTSTASCDQILNLGGQCAVSAAGATGISNLLSVDQYGAIVLTLPHSIPSGVGKSHPFPTDLLTQQVQVTVELYTPASIFSVSSAGGATSNPYSIYPTGLATAQFVVQQVVMNNAGDLLARRVDMAVNAYAFPCEFVQQVQRINIPGNTTSVQSLVLTGFRSGEVKAIHCWLTDTSTGGAAGTGAPLANGSVGVYNPFLWSLPTSIKMTYAGDVYAFYDAGSSPLWNLINGNKAPFVNNLDLVQASPTPTAAAFVSQWVELPFAQTLVDEDSHYILSHGKPITNGIVNIDIATPYASATWVLNVSYIYNSTLLMSQGTCDYVF